MSSGDMLGFFTAQSALIPSAKGPQYTLSRGGSNPIELIPALAFDKTAIEYADFLGQMPDYYDGGGVTVDLVWYCVINTGDVVWAAAFRRMEAEVEDFDSLHSYAFNGATDAAPDPAGSITHFGGISFTDGADMDSVAAGETFVLRVQRTATDGSDNLNNDALLWSIALKES